MSKFVFALASAAAFAKACPGSSTETPPADVVDLDLAAGTDIQGTPSVQFSMDEDVGDTTFYVLETTTNGAEANLWFLMPDGMTLPSTFDMFGYGGSMIAMSVTEANGEHWGVDSGVATFPDFIRAGEQVEIVLEDMYLYQPEFDLSDEMSGTMTVTIPNNADAQAFEAAYCP